MADRTGPNYYSAEEATMLFLGDYVDDRENFFWKWNFAFLQSFQSHYICQTCPNYPRIKLEQAL